MAPKSNPATTFTPLVWEEEFSARLGTSSFTCSVADGEFRIGHHSKSDDLAKIGGFRFPMEPEFSGYDAWKAARDAVPRRSAEYDRLNAMMLGNNDISYFATAEDAIRLLEIARAGISKTVEEILAEAGFVKGNTHDYPSQGRSVTLWEKSVKSGHFEIGVENGRNIHLTYQTRGAMSWRNLMNVTYQHHDGEGGFQQLFWPSFVTPQAATLMAITLAADYVAQGRTARRKRG